MHLFSNYLQPLMLWLHLHPHWALVLTFFVAFTESLAIIGSIIPGSVTMTAIGILAGSGVMRIDLTLAAAILGAIVGDGISYMLGNIFSERLVNIWPFSHYPNWLNYGKDYFNHHGGKSVIIGRFVGPLRSIIPVIAGMMHMSHWRFFIANALSAVAWSILYIFPGILIGAASNELSPEQATHLFLVILIILVSLWLLSLTLKWCFIKLNQVLHNSFHKFWLWVKNQPATTPFFKLLTPSAEVDHYRTVALIASAILLVGLFFLIIGLAAHKDWIVNLNQSTHLFIQSLRTHAFDVFFIIISQFTSPLNLIATFLLVCAISIYYRDWRSLAYWLSLNFFCTLIILAIHWQLPTLRPQGLWDVKTSYSFPLIELSYAVTMFSSLIFYFNSYCLSRITRFLRVLFILSLIFAGIGAIYLGDNWLNDCLSAYIFGLSLSVIHWLFYRRKANAITYSPVISHLLLGSFLLIALISSLATYDKSLRNHQPYLAQHLLMKQNWWNQQRLLLPIYRTNRIGKPVALFNIQYVGSLEEFEKALLAFGWQKPEHSLLNSLVTRIKGQATSAELPLMAQLYLNRKPVLTLTYPPTKGNPEQFLQMWQSNFHLEETNQPLWLGSVHSRNFINKTKMAKSSTINSLLYLSAALPQTLQRHIILDKKLTKNLIIAAPPLILLIKEKQNAEKTTIHDD